MEIASLGPNNLTVCDCCGLLILNQLPNEVDWLEELCDQLKTHIATSPKCKEYYDNLPSFKDVLGIYGSDPDFTGGLSPEEFIKKQRGGE